jgi:hypothetical protein
MAKLGIAPGKFNKAMSPILGAERLSLTSVKDAEPAYDEQDGQEFHTSGKDRLFPEEHVKPKKRKKAIGHIEKLLGQISEVQGEIDNALQTETHLEQEISDSMNKVTKGNEMNLEAKTKKIVQKLQALGKKYGYGSPPDYTIQSHHQLSCKTPDGTTREITVVVREEDISIFLRPNPPEWFEGDSRVEDALKELERLLESPNGSKEKVVS